MQWTSHPLHMFFVFFVFMLMGEAANASNIQRNALFSMEEQTLQEQMNPPEDGLSARAAVAAGIAMTGSALGFAIVVGVGALVIPNPELGDLAGPIWATSFLAVPITTALLLLISGYPLKTAIAGAAGPAGLMFSYPALVIGTSIGLAIGFVIAIAGPVQSIVPIVGGGLVGIAVTSVISSIVASGITAYIVEERNTPTTPHTPKETQTLQGARSTTKTPLAFIKHKLRMASIDVE